MTGVQTCALPISPAVLQVPEQVEVRKVDLAVEMQILSFHVARRHGEPALNGAAANGSAHGGKVLGASVNATANGSVNGSVTGRAVLPQ